MADRNEQNLEQPQPTSNWLTLPNALSLARLVGSPALIFFAWQAWTFALLIWVIVMICTEWLDGFLARLLHQQSKLGARLDTVADAVFYSCVLVALSIYDLQLVLDQAYWIAAAIVSYWLGWIVSWAKFRRLPSYHTLLAKGAWVVIAIGTAAMIADWTPWIFRLSMLIVVLANVEAILISLILKKSQVDVLTFWHALKSHDEP